MTKSGHAFTPAKTRKAERDIRMMARQAMAGRQPMTGPLRCRIEAVFKIASSWPRWKRNLALEGKVAHTSKPDGDNVAKLAKDACNGIVWLDDAQVVELAVCKQYGATPALRITVDRLPGICSQTRTRAESEAA